MGITVSQAELLEALESTAAIAVVESLQVVSQQPVIMEYMVSGVMSAIL